MAFCEKCGKALDESARFCPGCGAPVSGTDRAAAQTPFEQANTNCDEAADAAQNKGMAILAYIGILVLVPLFAAKDSPFARYHVNQSLVLWIIAIVYGIASRVLTTILSFISWQIAGLMSNLLGLFGWVFVIFMILGIVNAAGGQKKPLPVIGEMFTLFR